MEASILFRYVEPLMFRSIQARAGSMLVPMPSVLSGALVTTLMEGLDEGTRVELLAKLKSARSWTEEHSEALKHLGINPEKVEFYGPYIVAYEDGKPEVLVPFSRRDMNDTLVRLEDVAARLREALAYTSGFKIVSELEDALKNVAEYVPGRYPVTGIRIIDVRKAVERAMIYTAEHVEYAVLYKYERGEAEKLTPMRVESIALAMDVRDGEGKLVEKVIGNVVTGIGGDRRVVIMSRGEAHMLKTLKADKSVESRQILLYAVSPIVYETKADLAGSLKKDIAEVIKEAGVSEVRVVGRIAVQTLGFSLSKNIRKPAYQFIYPGAVIYAKLDRRARLPASTLAHLGLKETRGTGFGTTLLVA